MEKIYCGSAKIVKTQYGELTKVSMHKNDIQKIVDYMAGDEWVNMVIKEKKEPKPGKPTHYLEVDTWKPESKENIAKADGENKALDKEMDNVIEDDGLPF